MNTKDLMIGDWVNLNFDIDYKTGESIYAPVQVTGINKDGTVDVNFTYDKSESMQDGWDLKLIEPIPLTPEILEKNNDILYGELAILFDDGKMRYSIVECRYVSKEYERNNETFYCLLSSCVYNGGSFITPFAKIRYVHELQHALKLCGIEKEIIL